MVALILLSRLRIAEKEVNDIEAVCRDCSNTSYGPILCDSIDCPVMYRRDTCRRRMLEWREKATASSLL